MTGCLFSGVVHVYSIFVSKVILIAFAAVSSRHDLPMFLHDRNTDGDFLRVMTEHRSRICGGVVHSFTGTIEEMEVSLQNG